MESGSYGSLKSMEGGQKHHAPSNSSMNKFGVKKSDGTAINMGTEAHSYTASFKNSAGSKAFRNLEVKLLQKGRYDLVWDINAANIRDIYVKLGYDVKYIDAALGKAKTHFFKEVVPKISSKP